MKKVLKWGAILAGVLVVLLIAAAVTFKIMFPPEKIKTMAQGYAKQYLGREITFDSVSFRLIGISLDNFAMSEAATFDAGTFASAKSVVAKVALMPLLKKDIQISEIGLEGFNAKIIKHENGKFNFDDITERFAAAPAKTPEQEKQTADAGLPFNLSVDSFYIKNSNVSFTDNTAQMKAEINDINVTVDDFKLNGDFIGKMSLTAAYAADGLNATVPVNAQFGANLADMDLAKAYAKLKSLTADYNGLKINFAGDVKDFNNPKINFSGVISGITNAALKDFAAGLPAFALPDINFSTQTNVSLDNSSADIKTFKANVKNSTVDAHGTAAWAKGVTYNITAAFHLVLSELGQAAPDMLKGFNISNLDGTVDGGFTIKPEDIKGAVNMTGAGLAYKPVADVRGVTGQIDVLAMTNIKADGIKGVFNGGNFNADFAFKEINPNLYDVNFGMNLDKLTITELPKASAPAASAAPAAAEQNSAPGPKFNITAKANIGPIDVPFFESDGASVNAALTNVDAALSTMSGVADFNVKHSTITDLDSFMHTSKIARVGFVALKVVSSVAGILKLDILHRDTAHPKGLQITSMTGAYNFNNGLMTIKDTSINSQISTIKATGTADFNTDKLNMHASATVVAKQPIVIKIGGTMSEPKGTLDVVSTAVSVVPGLTGTSADVVKGIATNATGAVKSVIDIFKKDPAKK